MNVSIGFKFPQQFPIIHVHSYQYIPAELRIPTREVTNFFPLFHSFHSLLNV